MTASEFYKAYSGYVGQREEAFYWVEVPKTVIWYDKNTNELCSDLGINLKCDDYETVWDCVNDLCDAVAVHYSKMGIDVREAIR